MCKLFLQTQIDSQLEKEDSDEKSSKRVESKPTLDLITKLTSLLLQIRDYANSTATSTSESESTSNLNNSVSKQFQY